MANPDTTASLLSMAFPTPLLLLLFFALLLSTTFRLTTSNARIGTHTKKRLTTLHAFAIEGTQLLFLLSTVYQSFRTAVTGSDPLSNARGGFSWSALCRLAACVSTHTFAILAVDAFETLLALGVLRHPVQVQTFVLVRKVLWPRVARIYGRLGMWVAGVPVPKAGGVTVVASGWVDLERTRRVVLPQTPLPRRMSTGELEGVLVEYQHTALPRRWTRRHSFPDEQLNTRPLVRDSRDSDTRATTQAQDRNRATTVLPYARRSSTSTSSSSGEVGRIIKRIERSESRSREKEATAAKGHMAPTWRPAGGRVKG